MHSGNQYRRDMNKKKFIFIWAFVCLVLCFLCNKDVVNPIIYMVITLPLALYFFPIKPILERHKHINIKTKYLIFVSNFVLAAILSLSIMAMYISGNRMFEITKYSFFFFNAIIAYYNLFFREDNDTGFLHFMFLCFLYN